MTALFDFLVIGDDAPSLCAAACAARAGALVALARPPEPGGAVSSVSVPNIPNAVWRRLDLHEYGLTVEPVSARVTLLENGAPVVTHADRRETGAALAAAGIDDYSLWPDFIAELESLERDDFIAAGASGAPLDAARALTRLLTDVSALDRAAQLSGTCRALLDDVFGEACLKDHTAAHALAPHGLGGAEAGSAIALADGMKDDAWRMRVDGGPASLHAALLKACEQAGVQIFIGEVRPAPAENGKSQTVVVGDQEKLKTRFIFFASPAAAMEAGAGRCAPGAALSGGGAVAAMRIRLAETVDAPAHDKGAVFQIIDDSAELEQARDMMVSGRLPEKIPVEFEFTPEGDIVARTSYCPAQFSEDGEERGWTSQDRQAVAARIKERLLSRMPGLAEAVRGTRISVSAPPPNGGFAQSDRIIVQPNGHNPIGAAVSLIDRVMASDA